MSPVWQKVNSVQALTAIKLGFLHLRDKEQSFMMVVIFNARAEWRVVMPSGLQNLNLCTGSGSELTLPQFSWPFREICISWPSECLLPYTYLGILSETSFFQSGLSIFSVLDCPDSSQKCTGIGQEERDTCCDKKYFNQITGWKSFIMGIVKLWKKLLKEAVKSPFLERFRVWLDKALSSLI